MISTARIIFQTRFSHYPELRILVATVVGMVGKGMAEAEILNAYPDLEVEDVREALRSAAEAVRERELPVVGSS